MFAKIFFHFLFYFFFFLPSFSSYLRYVRPPLAVNSFPTILYISSVVIIGVQSYHFFFKIATHYYILWYDIASSYHVNHILQCLVLNLAITLECFGAINITRHLANQIRVMHLEIGITDKGTPRQMAWRNQIDRENLCLSGSCIPYFYIANNTRGRCFISHGDFFI